MRRPRGSAYLELLHGFRVVAGSVPGPARVLIAAKLDPSSLGSRNNRTGDGRIGGLASHYVDPWLRTFPVTPDALLDGALVVPSEVRPGSFGPQNTLWLHVPSAARLSVSSEGSTVTKLLCFSSANLGAWIENRSSMHAALAPYYAACGWRTSARSAAQRLHVLLACAAAGGMPERFFTLASGRYSDPTTYFHLLEN